MAKSILLNPYVIAVGIPLLLLVTGAFAKKLARGTAWQRSDFYLGVEFTLAAFSSALVHFFDLARKIPTTGSVPLEVLNQVTATALFVSVAFFFLFWVLTTQQDWGPKHEDAGQFWRLGLLANLVGSGLMCGFVLLVKGV